MKIIHIRMDIRVRHRGAVPPNSKKTKIPSKFSLKGHKKTRLSIFAIMPAASVNFALLIPKIQFSHRVELKNEPTEDIRYSNPRISLSILPL